MYPVNVEFSSVQDELDDGIRKENRVTFNTTTGGTGSNPPELIEPHLIRPLSLGNGTLVMPERSLTGSMSSYC